MYKEVSTQVDFPRLERGVLELWESDGTFEKLREKNQDGPRWSFIDGPITANAPMGVHHAWGRTLKDLYQRYRAMTGHRLRYQNGFDCQGLWVEVEVEKELREEARKQIEAGADPSAPQIIASASPRAIMRKESPTACAPVVQAVAAAELGPLAPARIDT